jgi:hypothetical protein
MFRAGPSSQCRTPVLSQTGEPSVHARFLYSQVTDWWTVVSVLNGGTSLNLRSGHTVHNPTR